MPTPIQLHNTLTRKVEPLSPLSKERVTLYTCGPTVYNYQHLGNMRAFLVDDFLRRSLDALGYNVRHVMNVTDVGHLQSDADEGEDKLESGALREGKSVTQIADHYTDAFKHDLERLNVLEPNGYDDEKRGDHLARATDFIAEQIDLTKRLMDAGYAYQAQQAIYFDVNKLSDYGILTGQRLSDKEVAVRAEVVSDSDKHSPQDFALWFFRTGRFSNHTMHWPSPWGDGFPGWHLECSAIVHATLGDPIDIHTGGVEHIGVHHPNEMAQTEAGYEHPLAQIWLHYNHLQVEGQKMAKSTGNVFVLQDLIDKGYSPLAFRLLALQTHYRSEQNFTWEALASAQAALDGLYGWADLVHQDIEGDPLPKDWLGPIRKALADDLGTPEALSHLFALTDRYLPTADALKELDRIFGLGLSHRSDITHAQKDLISDREEARSRKDWSKADEFRAKLAAEHLEIDDTPAGPRWRRIR